MRVTHVALALGLACSVSLSFSHVVLADQAALAGTSYRATLRVGHGCDGSPVTTLRVTIPNAFTGAKPMPKAGWVLTTKVGKLAKPYDNHGTPVTQDVALVSWAAASREALRATRP